MQGISLGPFLLDAPIGRGGMGEVWRGRHREQGTPVAVKVLSSRIADDPTRLTSFHDEIQAVAGLEHPNIVWVMDAGTVDAQAAAASKRRLLEGNPYLVMELSTGGTLANMRVDSWEVLRETLLTLLDALAHAHARGVAHLDLKPGNVLLAGPDDLRPGLKLTDFGIASALEETQETKVDTITGTLAYMAPEQIRAEWRDYGPWTDLYALGCLTWKLAVGRGPFVSRNPVALMRAQLQRQPPRLLDPPFEVPPGLDEWVGRMLEKAPWERFQCAADAAEALRALGRPGAPVPAQIDDDTFADLPTVLVGTLDPSEVFGDPTAPVPVPDDLPSGPHRDAIPDFATIRPAVPADWRRGGPDLRSPRLVGAGIQLFGVRSIPIAGREEERDDLWDALHEVHETGSARVITVGGAAGRGKTLLARWLTERAREVGAASVLKYRFEPGAPADEGLRLMLRRFFRVQRLQPEQRLERISSVLDHYGGPPELAVAVDAVLDEDASPGRRARYLAIRQVLEVVADQRPLILWFDDVHWGIDALRLADHLLSAQRVRPSPILVLLTYRSELLAERQAEGNRLRLLEGHRDVSRIELGPLPAADHAALARALLPLAPTLAAQAADRTAGNPQFLHELVGDWVERDQLVLGPTGYELKSGTFEVPASMDAVWRLRVLRLLDGLPDQARVLLERAAVLGREVDDEEWQTACDDPDGHYASVGRVYFRPRLAALRAELRKRLQAARIIEATDTGWTFAHAMLRHTLERMAKEGRRWEEHHRACATMLANQETLRPGDHERLGRHLVEAGDPVGAFEPLLQGVAHREAAVGFQAALGLVAWIETSLDGALPAHDHRWGLLWARRAGLYASMEDVAQARRWAERVWQASDAHGWPAEARARAAYELGKAALHERRPDEAEQWLSHMVRLLDRGEAFLLGSAWYHRSMAARLIPDPGRARELGAQAAVYLNQAARDGSAAAWRMLGNLAFLDGDLDRARGYVRKARARSQEQGDLVAVAEAWNVLADISRKQGDLDDAERGYHRAVELYGQAGASDHVPYPFAALALVHLARSSWEEARAVATSLRSEVEWRNRDALACSAHALLAAANAGLGVWEDVEHYLERCRLLVEEGDIIDADLAWTLELTGTTAALARSRRPAREALRMALAQYKRLGDRESMMRIHARFSRRR